MRLLLPLLTFAALPAVAFAMGGHNVAVPEPASFVLLGAAVAGFGAVRLLRR